MNRTLFLLLLFFPLSLALLPAQSLQDSTIYGLNFANSQLRYATADVRDGSLTIVNNTPTSPDQFGSGVSDINPTNGNYYYIRNGKVYTVDGTTGAVLHSPTITCATDPIYSILPITNIAYDWLYDELYGLHFYNGNLKFAKVDRVTGVMTIISPGILSPDQFASGVADIDPVYGKYFYIRDNRILTVDVNTGTILADHPLSNPNGAFSPITNIAFNNVTEQLYGLNYIGGSLNTPGELRLAMVDPNNGNVTLISQQACSPDHFRSGVSDIQPATNLYTYVRGVGTVTELISVDLSTGLVVHSPNLQNPNNAVSPITNIAYRKLPTAEIPPAADFEVNQNGLSVDFRNISRYGRDFSWDFGDGQTHTAMHPSHTYAQPGTYAVRLITENAHGKDTLVQTLNMGAVNVPIALSNAVRVYPQPAADRFYLDGPAGSFRVTDIRGLEVMTGALQGDGPESFEVGGWSSGLYFVEGESAEGVWRKKLLLQ